MRYLLPAVLTSTLLAASLSTAQAADDHWSLGAQAGTTGFGGNVSWRFDDHFAVTAGYSGYTYDDLDHSTDDVDYKGDVDSDIYSVKLDYFPWATSGFFLSAGVVRPDVQLNVTGRPRSDANLPDTVSIGGQTYNSSDIDSLDGRAELADGIEPYLGLGWRNSAKQGLGFYAEAGAFLINPDVSLNPKTNTDNQAVNALLNQYADEEEDDLQDDLDDYRVYPVAVIGVEYTF